MKHMEVELLPKGVSVEAIGYHNITTIWHGEGGDHFYRKNKWGSLTSAFVFNSESQGQHSEWRVDVH